MIPKKLTSVYKKNKEPASNEYTQEKKTQALLCGRNTEIKF